MTTPVHIAVDHPEKGRMTIFWDDGSACVYELAALRKACPCAGCRELRQQMDQGGSLVLLASSAIDPSVEIGAVDTVGRYALQFTWNDGHNTGIYTYEFLQETGSSLE
ncbi:MAG: DUF971 domain-containing protein [candidate division Zixibacteria bacterium]|nr:DUF971 domain-containing protein [candidate division Zixibacteria bacterium]